MTSSCRKTIQIRDCEIIIFATAGAAGAGAAAAADLTEKDFTLFLFY